MPCFESHVSLEFITDVADGLLLYSGPLAQLQTWDHEDFMAIGNNTKQHQFSVVTLPTRTLSTFTSTRPQASRPPLTDRILLGLLSDPLGSGKETFICFYVTGLEGLSSPGGR